VEEAEEELRAGGAEAVATGPSASAAEAPQRPRTVGRSATAREAYATILPICLAKRSTDLKPLECVSHKIRVLTLFFPHRFRCCKKSTQTNKRIKKFTAITCIRPSAGGTSS